MANLTKELNNIMNAVYGEEVRGSIHDAIEAMNKESTNAEAAATSAKDSAKNSANAAANSATAAKNSQNAAASSASAAKTSETNAKTSENNANTSKNNAATSATNAANSATAAKNSQNAAKTSETNAANSATAAKNSQSAAASSASAAKTSETNAKTSETNAKTSENKITDIQSDMTKLNEAFQKDKADATTAINNVRDSAITSVNNLKTSAETAITNTKTTAIDTINNTKTSAVNTINSTKTSAVNDITSLNEDSKDLHNKTQTMETNVATMKNEVTNLLSQTKVSEANAATSAKNAKTSENNVNSAVTAFNQTKTDAISQINTTKKDTLDSMAATKKTYDDSVAASEKNINTLVTQFNSDADSWNTKVQNTANTGISNINKAVTDNKSTLDDLVSKASTSATNAKTSETNASKSATAAAGSATTAKNEADRAATEAEKAKAIAGVTYMTGATASANGTGGFVPAPMKGKQSSYLRGDGTWQTPLASEIKLSDGSTLQSYVDGDKTSGTSLANQISTEVSTRSKETSTLTTNLNNEVTNRSNADKKLQEQITANDTDISNLQKADTTEANTRSTAVKNLQDQITANANKFASYFPLSGGALTGNISYKGSKATYAMIKWKDNTSDTYGNGMVIGGGGLVVIGGGESSDAIAATFSSGGDEHMVIANDAGIDFYTNAQNGAASAKHTEITTDGKFTGTIDWGNINGKPSSYSPSTHSHSKLNYKGNHAETASGNTANAPTSGMADGQGLYLTGTYNDSATPVSYGNIINAGGSGSGQLLLEWSGSDNTTGNIYYRSHRDTSSGGWGAWKRLAYATELPTKSSIGLGNADNTADANKTVKLAKGVVDAGDGRTLNFNYSAAGMTSTSWLGSWNGNTLQAISPANIKAGSASKADVATTANKLTTVTVDSGNTGNYTFHRFAYVQNVTGQWSDTDSVFLIRQKFDGGSWGIIKVSMRTNGTNSAVSVQARWLARSGFAVNSVQWGRWGVTGNSCYADLFVMISTYARMEVVRLSSDASSWTMCTSNEPNNTTTSDKKGGTNVYASLAAAGTELHNQAYTATGSASDVATVNYANYADSANKANYADSANKANYLVANDGSDVRYNIPTSTTRGYLMASYHSDIVVGYRILKTMTLSHSSWSSSKYSLESSYPKANYDIEELQPYGTAAQLDAFAKAKISGSPTENVMTATGTVPTIDIPVMFYATQK